MINVESLLNSANLVDVVGSYTAVIKRGGEYVARCCSGTHDDNNPSMYIIPAKNGKKACVHCFSC